jgi:hypothetical protein
MRSPMQTLPIRPDNHLISITRRAPAACAGAKCCFSAAILFAFLAAVIVLGMWAIALHTGFVGAIGPLDPRSRARA